MTSSSALPTILIVATLWPRQRLAADGRFNVVAIEGPGAAGRVREDPPDVVLAPTSADGFDGVSFCDTLKRDVDLSWIPVILTATAGDAGTRVRAFDAGADDCIDDSIAPEVLAARMSALIRRGRLDREVRAASADLEVRVNRLESELRAVHRNAHQLEAIGRLAGGVAHNFNNLLTIVLVSSELLMSELPEGSPQWAHARETYDAGNRAAGLTNQLLAFSRRQMLRPVNVDLGRMVADMTGVLRDTLGDGIELRVVSEEALPQVYVDPSQMRRVVLDLAIHSRDSMPHGGAVVVETHRVVLTEAYVADKVVVQPGAYVLLAISDTGPGMDVDTQLRLFEPFFTTSTQRGSELGLSTVYGIVKQSGGYIWVYSERGRGTTFKIYLPEASAVRGRSPAAGIGHQLPRGQASVLLVDDEAALRAVASKVLESCGYRVVTAGSGDEALAMCLDGLEPDLVITDVVMPGMNGNQLVARLRSHRGGLRVLFTSGFSAEAVALHGVAPGEHFLSKPFTPSDLAHKVREVLGEVPAR